MRGYGYSTELRLTLLSLIIILIPALIIGSVRLVFWVQFDRYCEGYLKRAADSSTVELAAAQLGHAVKYLEQNMMTRGYTSIIYTTPDEDVGFWYGNLQSSLGELQRVKPDAAQLERTNVLMKLRETLIDHSQNGVSVTCPWGISVYPFNSIFALLYLLSAVWAYLWYLKLREKY